MREITRGSVMLRNAKRRSCGAAALGSTRSMYTESASISAAEIATSSTASAVPAGQGDVGAAGCDGPQLAAAMTTSAASRLVFHAQPTL
jgi:hypothetical protein